MDLFKLDKYDKYFVAFILVVLVVFNIGSFVFAYEEEDVQPTYLSGIVATENSNSFSSNSNYAINYIKVEKGYKYTIEIIAPVQGNRLIVGSSSAPAVNVNYDILYSGFTSGSYTYVANNDNYLFITLSPNISVANLKFTRIRLDSQETAVDDLVNNVGVNQLWGVFENGIDFVGVVVLVGFGLFLVILLIKKMSKGKSEF